MLKTKLKEHAWVITGILTAIYLIGSISNGRDWLVTGALFAIATVVLMFFKKKKASEQPVSKVIEKTETFDLRGINHDGRQDHVRKLKAGQGLTPRFYLYENEPAVELLTHGGNSVGFAPKELAPRFTSDEYVFMVERVYDFGDGRKGAEIRVLM